MKRCPYCAEEIQDAAIACKHCGRDIAVIRWPQTKSRLPTMLVELPYGHFLVSAQPNYQRASVWRFEGLGIVTGPNGVRIRRPSLDNIFNDLHSADEKATARLTQPDPPGSTDDPF